MKALGGTVLAAALLAAAGGQAFRRDEPVTKAFAPSSEDFPNPERGMILFVDLLKERDLGWVKRRGVTLIYVGISLAPFRGGPLDAAFLARLEEAFRGVRRAGLKAVLRFTYSGNVGEADAPRKAILEHIRQLRPFLEANADVIAVLQAGFIGAWGEWHGSTHGLDTDEARREVLQALLAALPASRMLQVRTPDAKQRILGGGPLEDAEAFKGHPRARVGHHNDAFFSDANDMGTYPEPVRNWKEWVAQEGRFVPVGGETTAGPPRGDGAEFAAELARLRWSFLHLRYPPERVQAWEKEGRLAEVRRELGYRLALVDASWPAAARPGGELRLKFRVKNAGFAAPFNRRPVYAVLSRENVRYAARLSADPRRWEPAKDVKVSARLSIPANAPAGKYRLSLWLPDEGPALAERPEYAVRLANEGVWDPVAGLNVLTEDFRIDPKAGGSFNARFKDFAELP